MISFNFFKSKTVFLSKLQSGEITSDAICFIEDTGEIWTQGVVWGGVSVDKELSNTSENAISNKAVKEYIDNTMGTISQILDIINGE